MAKFESGKVLKTATGADVVIDKYIGGGGQGDVYMVDYGGKKRALKWYNLESIRNPDAFYKNLENNVSNGSPSPAFLWPLAVMEWAEGSFGYVMELRPAGYEEFTKILSSKECHFASFTVAVEACLQIISAFRILHNCGYSYQDLNDGNFFINPQNGNVLICDNDNVAPNGDTTGILGKPRYMAPEIVVGRGKVLPNAQSDRYSLATILFMILTFGHPLEGRRWLVPCLTDAIAEQLYGVQPLFVFDCENNANRPNPQVQKGLVEIWNCFPDYMKEAFVKAFSQEALKNPLKRLKEIDWLNVFARFRNDIRRCSCGCDMFLLDSSTTKCDVCSSLVEVKNYMQLPSYNVAVTVGTKIYRCQLGYCNSDDALELLFVIVANPANPNAIGVKNLTNMVLLATTPSGHPKQVPPGGIVPFMEGITLSVYEKKITLKNVQ